MSNNSKCTECRANGGENNGKSNKKKRDRESHTHTHMRIHYNCIIRIFHALVSVTSTHFQKGKAEKTKNKLENFCRSKKKLIQNEERKKTWSFYPSILPNIRLYAVPFQRATFFSSLFAAKISRNHTTQNKMAAERRQVNEPKTCVYGVYE